MASRPRTVKQGSIHTTVTHSSKEGGEQLLKDEHRNVKPAEDHNDLSARMRLSGGYTKNIGNYESARIDIAIEVPCKSDHDSIRAAYESTSLLLDELISKESEVVLGQK